MRYNPQFRAPDMAQELSRLGRCVRGLQYESEVGAGVEPPPGIPESVLVESGLNEAGLVLIVHLLELRRRDVSELETELWPGLRHRHSAKAAGQLQLPVAYNHRASRRLYVRRRIFTMPKANGLIE
jgi:hypothetical protein